MGHRRKMYHPIHRSQQPIDPTAAVRGGHHHRAPQPGRQRCRVNDNTAPPGGTPISDVHHQPMTALPKGRQRRQCPLQIQRRGHQHCTVCPAQRRTLQSAQRQQPQIISNMPIRIAPGTPLPPPQKLLQQMLLAPIVAAHQYHGTLAHTTPSLPLFLTHSMQASIKCDGRRTFVQFRLFSTAGY